MAKLVDAQHSKCCDFGRVGSTPTTRTNYPPLYAGGLIVAKVDEDRVRRDMVLLATIVKELRQTYPRMELGQLHVLLLVLARPGVNLADLAPPTRLTRSAVSRNALALSQVSYLDDETGGRRGGLDLLTHFPDPYSTRAKIVAPTQKGRALAERLSSILRGRAPLWLD